MCKVQHFALLGSGAWYIQIRHTAIIIGYWRTMDQSRFPNSFKLTGEITSRLSSAHGLLGIFAVASIFFCACGAYAQLLWLTYSSFFVFVCIVLSVLYRYLYQGQEEERSRQISLSQEGLDLINYVPSERDVLNLIRLFQAQAAVTETLPPADGVIERSSADDPSTFRPLTEEEKIQDAQLLPQQRGLSGAESEEGYRQETDQQNGDQAQVESHG